MKTKKIFLTLVLGLFTTFAFTQITGTKHDMKGETWNTNGEICITCHTPHNAIAAVPLWNHTETAASHTPYSNPATLDATVGAPSGASKLCLSCHDGTVNVDAYGGAVGTVKIASFGTGAGDFGIDLSNEHPISFLYDDALATTDGGLHPPTTTVSGLAGGGFIQGDLLFNGNVECSSCHDVHNAAGGETVGLLRVTNAGSALCLTCHNK